VASKNGTILNGKKIPQPTKLQFGDQITLCNRRLTFHIAEVTGNPPSRGDPIRQIPGYPLWVGKRRGHTRPSWRAHGGY